MRKLVLALYLATVGWGQANTNILSLGVSYTPSSSPTTAVSGLYAHQVQGGQSDTWAFTLVDAIPTVNKTITPGLQFQTDTTVGVAQRVATVGRLGIYIPMAAGFSWTGSNMGWSWTSGGMAVIPVSYNKVHGLVMPSVRYLKSSVSNGSGYQLIAGVMFGWGF